MNEKEEVIGKILSSTDCIYKKEELEKMNDAELIRIESSLFLPLLHTLNTVQLRVICAYEVIKDHAIFQPG
jgi:hypothetical protein